MYSWLALQMNIPEKDAHVSKFTRAQCQEAIKILRPKYIQLFGRDLVYERKVKSKMRLQVTGSEIFETAHILPKRSENYDGISMYDAALELKNRGCYMAYNLDGGGSTTLYFNGEVLNNPSDITGERRISDILYFTN